MIGTNFRLRRGWSDDGEGALHIWMDKAVKPNRRIWSGIFIDSDSQQQPAAAL